MIFYFVLKMVEISSFEISSTLLRHHIPEDISFHFYRHICTEVRVSWSFYTFQLENHVRNFGNTLH